MTGMVGPMEDLGWNDMGSAEQTAPPLAEATHDTPAPVPPVLAEREALREEIESPAPETAPTPVDGVASDLEPVAEQGVAPEPLLVARPVSVATAARLARESAQQTKKGKAAFTLRLDGERHLRLRLASALTGRSAQHLVTGALDDLLRTLPDVDLLVAQLPPARQSTR